MFGVDDKSILWLFCTKLLDGIMKYIKGCNLLCSTILNNFTNIIAKKNRANEEQKQLFQNIEIYCDGNNDTETSFFERYFKH